MFEFLFNYRSELFSQGELTFLAGPVRLLMLSVGLALTAWALHRYRKSLTGSDKASGPVQGLLLALRALGVGALVVALLEPALALSAIKPQESFVAVLADTSASMTVTDTEDLDQPAATRAAWLDRSLVGAPFDNEPGDLWRDLATRFQVRAYAFDETAGRIDFAEPLSFDGRRSDLGSALTMVRSELTGVPLAGVVVLTDGAIESTDVLIDESLRFRSAGIPIFPVAVGSARFDRDLEIAEIRVPRRTLLGSTVLAQVQIGYPGFAGETITVEIRDEGRVIQQRTAELPVGGDDTMSLELSFRTQAEGTRSLEFAVTPQSRAAEAVTLNNTKTVLLEVESGPHKILYFEGEPRFEYKFIRRAVAEDPQLQLVSLLRMADNRFYRQSVDGEDELRGGFPTRREELFKYRGLVLGSIEASFFTYEQMRMIVDFAAERGGGVLFLGGSNALAEGGYAGTPLSELIPTELSDRREVGPRGVSVNVQPTALGREHAALQLQGTSDDAFWASLPELLVLNRTGRLKPGAAALLAGQTAGTQEAQLVLAHQRFGAGSSMLFLPTDSFRWQMRLPTEDQTHEILWRQILRWLINGVDDRVVASPQRDRVELGGDAVLEATVRDQRFQADPNALVEAEVTSPSGATSRFDLTWDPLTEGRYSGELSVNEPGLHAVTVFADTGEGSQATAATAKANFTFEAGSLNEEFFGAVRQAGVMTRLASETGGQTFAGNDISALIDQLSYSTAGVTVREERPLWNMPILLCLILLGLLGEWSARRWKGLR